MVDHRNFKTVLTCLLVLCLGIAVSTCAKKTTEPEVAPQPEVVAPAAEEPAQVEAVPPVEEMPIDTVTVEPAIVDTAEALVTAPPIEEVPLDTVVTEPVITETAEAPPTVEKEVVPPVREEPPPPEPVAEPSIVVMDARSYGEMLKSMLPQLIEKRLSDVQVSGTMQVGTTHSGSLLLDQKAVVESLAAGLTMPDGTPIKPLPFDLSMRLQLSGDEFDIDSRSRLDQSLLQAPALWEYGITPRQSGLQGLRLSGTLQLTVDGTQMDPFGLAPLDTNIMVQSAGRSGAFWLLIIVILIVLAAVGGYIYYRWQTAPPKPEPKATKPPETKPGADKPGETESGGAG